MNKLSSSELDILHSFLPKSLFEAVSISDSTRGVEEIDDETKDKVRDICIERLDLVGFDQNYNLTPTGEILEALIDKLFIG